MNSFFKSQKSDAENLELKDKEFLNIWQDYHKTVDEKKALISAISVDNYQNFVPRLKALLTLELSDIEDEKISEKGLIAVLNSIEHDERMLGVMRLYDRLCYAENKYKYIYVLLEKLQYALRVQIHIVEKLESGKEIAVLIAHLKSEFAVEQEIVKQIESRETFHELFLALVKGEQIIGRMDAKEKQLLKRMKLILTGSFEIKSRSGPERKKGITYGWANKVYTGIKIKVKEFIASHEQDEVGQHEFSDFEFVNHPDFVDFVRKCALELGDNPSEQMINVFVHTFRELYNDKK